MRRWLFTLLRRGALGQRGRSLAQFLDSVPLSQAPVPARARALVLAPHQDDETFGCGGTIWQLIQSGGAVDVVYLTGGEKGGQGTAAVTPHDVASLRRTEAAQACACLGAQVLQIAAGSDGELHLEVDMHRGIAAILAQKSYDLVFAPWPYDYHSDHEAAFRLLQKALRLYRREVEVWLYEVWAPLLPNRLIDVTDAFAAKLAAIGCYQSQLSVTNYTKKSTALAEFRSLGVSQGQFSEAFATGNRAFILGWR